MDIEKKALELVNLRRDDRGSAGLADIRLASWHDLTRALYEAIEAHEADKARHAAEMEAFRREVDGMAREALDVIQSLRGDNLCGTIERIARFIIPQPDPLAQKVREIAAEHNIELTEEVAALIASHLSVVKKEPSQ